MFDYDVVIIGAGSAGLVACKLANGLGKKVALIEKRKIGGDCTWFGCIPSKTLIKSAYIAHQTTRLKAFGLSHIGPVQLNAEKVMSHVRAVVEDDAAGHPAESYEAEGISVLFGGPRFIDNHRIELDDKTISSKKFIICTGSHPLVPDIEGLDKISYLTNETVFDLKVLPKSMIVLGAGPIGIELSSALNRLGVDVTVLLRSGQILKKEDKELVDRLTEILLSEGVTISAHTQTKRFSQDNNKITVTIEDKKSPRDIEAESVLIAVGREPNLDELTLEKAGVECDLKGIIVNKHLRTTAKNIYAAGDVVPPYLFTHIAEYEAVIATTNACLPLPVKKANYENTLWCTYTDPELAHAGLTEEQARQKYGDKVKVYRWEFRDVDRAKTDLAQNGLSKFVCDRKGKLLGIHILGHNAAELMHEAQLAKSMGLPFGKIASVIHAYPSYSDAVRQPAKKCYIDVLQNNFFVKLLKKIKTKKNWNKRKNRMTAVNGQPKKTPSTAAQRGKRAALVILGIKLIVFCMILLGLIMGTIFLPVKEWLVKILEWTGQLGFWGPVIVVVLYIVACILFLPGSVLTLGTGFVFKLFKGTIAVSIGSTLGACAAFLIGRTVARGWISDKVAENEKFAAIDHAVGRQGFKIVFLTRLSPIFPFNMLNYAFGLTNVSFGKYALASWIGMLPGTIMYVYFGATLRSLADAATGNVETGTAGKIFFWFGLAATIAVTVFVTRVARRALKQAVPAGPAQDRQKESE